MRHVAIVIACSAFAAGEARADEPVVEEYESAPAVERAEILDSNGTEDTAAPTTTAVTTDEEPDDTSSSGGSAGSDVTRGTEKGTIGLGLILGEPTGVTARLYLKDDQAVQAAAGFAFIGGGVHVHADYVFHPVVFQTRESFVLAGYVGPGARVIQYRDGRETRSFAIGARGVAGLLFDFTVPLDAFVEVGGVLEYDFADEDGGFGIALNVGAGVRYYF